MPLDRFGQERGVMEWAFESGKAYHDPFNEIRLDVIFTAREGDRWRVPAFWGGEQEWRVRFSPPAPGEYLWQTECSDEANRDLHGVSGRLHVAPYAGSHPLRRHGPLRASANRRYLEHADGTPFFWLADTWWMGLTRRLDWPDGFQALAQDRKAKGFTAIQIVAGIYPDMLSLDPRGANEGGLAWEPEYARINPAFYDMADLRIQHLVRIGLVPCILACWGFHLLWLGMEKMKQHWRYLVARYGAYPVVWCLAGEATMPYYLSKTRAADAAEQKVGWTEIGRHLRRIDCYHHPMSIHPSRNARDCVEDVSVLDFEMLQTGHSNWASVPGTVNAVVAQRALQPPLPLINAEVCYEGHQESNWQDVQRFMFYSCLLSGTCGHTYGAGGIWQMNRREEPFGPSAHGNAYELRPWDVAAQLPGAGQLGLGKALLMRYPWWQFEPHPEWVEPRWSPENYMLPYAAGVPGKVRVVYIPGRIYQWSGPLLKQLDRGVEYRAFYFDPITGREYELEKPVADDAGCWQAPRVPLAQDWVLVVEAPS